jgi:endonuclease/exonuclease/phosphatase family metal-dependent hydrolase
MGTIRIATFNLENLDDGQPGGPSLAARIAIMRPQLLRVNADILCLQEVHSQGAPSARTLAALDAMLSGTPYETFHRESTRTMDGLLYDVRNVVTLCRFPIVNKRIIRDSDGPRPRYQAATANPPDQTADFLSWERPMLYTQIDLGIHKTLHVINAHLKSKIATSIAGQKINDYTWRTVSAWAEGSFISAMKRVGQALQLRMEIDKIFDADGIDALIVVCGDFNAEAREVEMKAICGPVEETGNLEHGPRLMVPCENNIPESSRYSLIHLGRGEMIDHVIASRGFIRYFHHAEVHNEALPDESGAFRQDVQFPESDHAPVVAEFHVQN